MPAIAAYNLSDSINRGEIHLYGCGLPSLKGTSIPCAVMKCADYKYNEGYAQRAVHWDHCHLHNIIRGAVCAGCNQNMIDVDQGRRWGDRFATYRTRCPECKPGRPPIPREWLISRLERSKRIGCTRMGIADGIYATHREVELLIRSRKKEPFLWTKALRKNVEVWIAGKVDSA